MTELELAIEWLKRRSLKLKSTDLSKNNLHGEVILIPISELRAVLEMHKDESFIDFMKHMKDVMNSSEIEYFNPEDFKE